MKTKINLPKKITAPSWTASYLKAFFLSLAGLTLSATACLAQVSVTATAGTAGPTAYTTLKGAFDALNAGTHQGAITIDITGDTTEGPGAVGAALNASGSGSASYTSVLVRPVGGARTITGNIVGAVIKLNGADNVTIDGRISGSGRHLTVSNSNASAGTAGIWLASVAAGNGASNNVIRNLEIACGGDQQAAAAASFGIIQTGTLLNVTNMTGTDNDNNSFIANRIIRVRYGIASRGVVGNNNIAPVITDNIIGPAAFGPDQIGRAGIYMTGDTGAIISRNTIQNVGVLIGDGAAGADRFGIALGAETWDVDDSTVFEGGDYTVTKNVIHDIVDEKTFSAVGIRLGTTRGGNVATNNLVANNFIFNIRANGGDGNQVCGIGYANGHTDRIVFNSISLTGNMDPPGTNATFTYGNAIRITQSNSSNNANLTLMDNSIYLDVDSEPPIASNAHFYAITTNFSYSFGTGGLNYNNYFIAADPDLRTGGHDNSAAGNKLATNTEFATLANWKTSFSAPQDANSIQADPLYVSNTSDLHIQSTSPNIDAGVAIAGVTDDIDGLTRPFGAAPDIGAAEFYPPATISINDVAMPEGNAGTTAFTFTVTLSNASAQTVRVDFAADNGSATFADSDYVFQMGTLTFAPNTTTQPITILVNGDTNVEPNEFFVVNLTNPDDASIADAQGQGNITDDDNPTPTPSPAPTPSPGATPTPSPGVTPTPTPGVVANVATRLPVGTDDNVLIEGFIVLGPNGSTKKIMVRALGPFLTQFGVPDALANPTLEIRDGSNTLIATNNDWKNTQVGGIITSDQVAEIQGSGLAPSNDLESAIIAELAPGNYTAVVRGVGNTVGTGIVDAYDLSPASPARLANVATRGLIQPGDQLMIAGFIIQSGDVRAVIRAIGPSLSAFGITNALPDTTLQLRDVNGAIVRENDDWESDQKAELEATGLQPGNALEAAIVATIPPGQYTAQVRGKPETTGIGVVEIYFLQ